MQSRKAGGEHSALADSQQADLVDVVMLANVRDTIPQIPLDVVVECEPSIGSLRIAPVHHIKVNPEFEQIADERAIFLQICHRVTTD